MSIKYREMTDDDYERVFDLWQKSEGVGLSDSDSADQIAHFLRRNSGLSQVALKGDMLIGAILCGHDGRRGYIHHLAVDRDYRRLGIGRHLVDRCLNRLKAEGIPKCHLFVFTTNHQATNFWTTARWTQREELVLMSILTGNKNS